MERFGDVMGEKHGKGKTTYIISKCRPVEQQLHRQQRIEMN